jgi:hypothetical protein
VERRPTASLSTGVSRWGRPGSWRLSTTAFTTVVAYALAAGLAGTSLTPWAGTRRGAC